jgi:ATP-dependent Lon protease
MEKTQREFLLRRQLEAIKKELGQLGDGDEASTPTTTAPRSPSATCPSTCAPPCFERSTSWSARATRAPRRAGSARGSTRSWRSPGASSPTTDSTISEAQRILNADHDGLEDVKDRILEHLAVRKLQAERV